MFVDYRVTTEGNDGSVSEDVDAVYERLVEIAHEVLDDSPHCEGFTVCPRKLASTVLHSVFARFVSKTGCHGSFASLRLITWAPTQPVGDERKW